MVNPRRFLINLALTLALTLAPIWLSAGADGSTTADEPSGTIPTALSSGSFPWYDSQKDQIKPVDLPRDQVVKPASPSSPRSQVSFGWLGQLIQIVGFAVAIVVLMALMFWFYRLYEPSTTPEAPASKTGQGVATATPEELPAGLRDEFELSDPWQEALRRRNRGDLSGAVVYLFAHQLLTLSRLGLVRLTPGRTARQLVKAVLDLEFRGLIHPSLKQFELVYYGHQDPTHEAFEGVWAAAEAFERRVATGARP